MKEHKTWHDGVYACHIAVILYALSHRYRNDAERVRVYDLIIDYLTGESDELLNRFVTIGTDSEFYRIVILKNLIESKVTTFQDLHMPSALEIGKSPYPFSILLEYSADERFSFE